MGAVFHIPVVFDVPLAEVSDFLAMHSIPMAATCLDTPDLHWDATLTGRLAIVFGNEGNGVSEEWLRDADQKLRIPIYGRAESLNVSASAAVLLYEVARQRRSCLQFSL